MIDTQLQGFRYTRYTVYPAFLQIHYRYTARYTIHMLHFALIYKVINKLTNLVPIYGNILKCWVPGPRSDEESGDESDGEEEDESAVLCLSESAIKMLMQ